MGGAIGSILPLAVGVAVSPLPIIAIVIMLGGPHARMNASALALGWLAASAALGTVLLLAAGGGGASDDGAPATWVSIVKLVLGVLVLALGVRRWRGRPRDGEPAQPPGWMKSVDRFSAGRSLVLGAAAAAVSPKNVALTVAAAGVIAGTGIGAGRQAVSLAIFVVIGASGVVLPLGTYLALGERSAAALGGVKTWMVTNNAAIMTVLLLILGTKIVGDAIGGLAS